MKIGLMLPMLHSLEVNAAALSAAEQLGADDIWLPDHMIGMTHPEIWSEYPASKVLPSSDAYLDPFCVAGALSGSTELPLGFCVTDATRRAGSDLARSSMTLHSMCKGGFILGLGAGEAESLLPFGYQFNRPMGNLERALQEIRSLFDHGTMPGELSGYTTLPDISERGVPKVWVAANRPRGLKLTGRYADGWLPIMPEPDAYAEQLAVVQAAADETGRPHPLASLLPCTIFGESRDQVAALIDDELPIVKLLILFSPDEVWQRYGLEHPMGPGCRGQVDVIPHELDPNELRALAPRIPIEMFEELVILGNAQEVAARLKPYADAGAEHVLFADMTGTTYAPEDTAVALRQLVDLKPLLQT